MLSSADIRAPALRRLYDDWQARRRGREFPARGDFDAPDLKYVLGNIAMFDVAYDPLRFRFRLHGSRIAQRVGYDMTGKDFEEMPAPGLRQEMRRHFTTVLETRAPRVEIRAREVGAEGVIDCEVLVLPLSRDGATIDILMVGVWFP